jgi:hypothetical protein
MVPSHGQPPQSNIPGASAAASCSHWVPASDVEAVAPPEPSLAATWAAGAVPHAATTTAREAAAPGEGAKDPCTEVILRRMAGGGQRPP